jgi:hypothetical protein
MSKPDALREIASRKRHCSVIEAPPRVEHIATASNVDALRGTNAAVELRCSLPRARLRRVARDIQSPASDKAPRLANAELRVGC